MANTCYDYAAAQYMAMLCASRGHVHAAEDIAELKHLTCVSVAAVNYEHPPNECIGGWWGSHGKIPQQIDGPLHEPGSAIKTWA